MKTLRIPVLLLAGLLLATGVSAHETPDFRAKLSQLMDDVPSEWQGIWNVTTTVKDCETGFIFNTTASTDTLCETSAIEPEDSEADLTCNTTINGSTATFDCTGSVEVDTNCTSHYDYQGSFSVTGNTYTGSVTFNITYTGLDCGEFTPSCIRLEFAGTRVANSSGVCLTPVEPTTWGLVKDLYRD